MKTRRRARIVALQALFEVDTVHHSADGALSNRLEDTPLPEPGASFAQALLMGTLANLGSLDALIQRIAPEWPIEQMAPVDRNILRLAAYEMLYDPETPPKVVINEAVEIAKLFGSDSSSRFVNGVLGTLFTQHLGSSASPAAKAKAGVAAVQETVAPRPGGQTSA